MNLPEITMLLQLIAAKQERSELNALLRANAGAERMLYFSHFSYEVGGGDQFFRGVAAGHDDVERWLQLAGGADFFEHFGDGQHVITQNVNQFIKDEQIVITTAEFFHAEVPGLARGLAILFRVLCVPGK